MLRRGFCRLILGAGFGGYGGIRLLACTEISKMEQGLPAAAQDALRKAVAFFDEVVSVQGGYVWAYSEDLSVREGEGEAGPYTAWVQPPGTPSVGMALLEAYRLTGEPLCLRAAARTAQALVKGQLVSGGWDYRIEFDPKARTRYRYRRPPSGGEKARNYSVLDDDNTQSAVRFLMEYDRETKFQEELVHEAVLYALQALMAAQRPNGGWPQCFVGPSDPKEYPDVPASYPEDLTTHRSKRRYYEECYTINDNAHADTLLTMLLAWKIYNEELYLAAARRGGEFLLKAQMPDPQPGWAQQYDAQMQPCWARKFEPPAITGGESQGVMRTLIRLYHETGDKKFLEPIPRALDYLEKSVLPDGTLARFYELKTNRPLYFTREYQLTYSDADLPTHYAFKVPNDLRAIRRQYEEAVRLGPRPSLGQTPAVPRLTPALEAEARRVVATLDGRGRWIEPGRLRTVSGQGQPGRIITTRTFIHNLGVLARYLAAASHSAPQA